VLCNGFTFYTKTKIIKDKIHTIAVTNKMDFKEVMELGPEIKIIKKKGIPFLIEDSTDIIKPVSLSHHGRFSTLVGLK
jgi:hypothetical protein